MTETTKSGVGVFELMKQIIEDAGNIYVQEGKKLVRLSEAPTKKQVLFVKTELQKLL